MILALFFLLCMPLTALAWYAMYIVARHDKGTVTEVEWGA